MAASTPSSSPKAKRRATGESPPAMQAGADSVRRRRRLETRRRDLDLDVGAKREAGGRRSTRGERRARARKTDD